MARRRSQVEVSMFPFLSVLCTVIGVLVLFIVLVLSTRVVQQDELYRRTAAHENQPQPGRPEAIEQGVDPLIYQQVEADIARLRTVLAQRHAERASLSQQIAALEDLLEFKKTQKLIELKPSRGRPLVRPERVVVVPVEGALPQDGFEVKLRPILVECASSGYTVYPSRQRFDVVDRSVDDGGDSEFAISPDLQEFLEGVDRRKKREYLVFLIHPNGIEAYENLNLYTVIHHGEIRRGWEPFSREWLVVNEQLQSMFEEKEKAPPAP